MASSLDPQMKLHLDVSVIDWHWYYGCLLSLNKKGGIHPVLLGGEKNHKDDGHEIYPQFARDDRGQHSSAIKNGGYEQCLRQEGKKSRVSCFGPIAFDPKKLCKEEEAECVDKHNDNGNEIHPQFAMDVRCQHSRAEKNGRCEQIFKQERKKSNIPCFTFGPVAFDSNKFCEEDPEEDAECVDNYNDNGHKNHPQVGKDDRGQGSSAEKNGRFEESYRQESHKSRVPIAFDQKEFCEDDVDEEVDCVDNAHNNDGIESSPQFAMDERGQHSGAQKNRKYEESLREESTERTVPCFRAAAFDPKKFYREDAEEDTECVACIFRFLDEDGDGRVSVDEIMSFLGRLSLEMPKEEVQLAVRSVLESAERSLSPCGDEFLNAMEFAEFYRFVFSEQDGVDPVKAEEHATCEAFGIFDQNGDGFISAVELADVLCRLGFMEERNVKCCQSMIESVDYNGDGFVDIHEFRHLITRTTYSSHPSLFCVSVTKA